MVKRAIESGSDGEADGISRVGHVGVAGVAASAGVASGANLADDALGKDASSNDGGIAGGAHAVNLDVPKKRRVGIVVAVLVVLALALAAAGIVANRHYAKQQTEQAYERMEEQTAQVAQNAFAHVDGVVRKAISIKDAADARAKEALAEELARRERILGQARQAAIDEAHAEAIARAHQEAVDAARAAYNAEVEAVRAQRSSDFADTILFGDSIMQNSQGALAATLPGVTIDAFGGRALEEGPPGTGFDPNDGVLDHIRAYSGGHRRVVVGTGNNDAGGMGIGAAEEIVAHFGEDVEIYFVTEFVGGNPGGTANTNATIADIASRYDNVKAIGWFELVSGDPGAYLSDGCHPLPGAMPIYAELIRDTISAYEPEPFDPESVPFDPESVPFDPESVDFDPSKVDLSREKDDAKKASEEKAKKAPELTDAIMGKSAVSAKSMVAAYEERGVPYSEHYIEAGAPTIDDFAKLCIEEADAEGVRAEVLFAQAMHETGWLQFGNQVSVEQNNFGGLGAVNSGGAGEGFPDVRTGLRAQVQHLKAYASTDDLKNECVDARFDLVERGCAPTVQDLGGRWAWPGDGYGDAIMAVVKRLYEIEYPQ